jgi:predicted RNase H-like HicB family nuclease
MTPGSFGKSACGAGIRRVEHNARRITDSRNLSRLPLMLGRQALPISGNLGYNHSMTRSKHDPRRALPLHHPRCCRDESGGYLIAFPDLPGCMSEGATIEDAITDGIDGMRGWSPAMRAEGIRPPPPVPSKAT